jgi:hypothetical protein
MSDRERVETYMQRTREGGEALEKVELPTLLGHTGKGGGGQDTLLFQSPAPSSQDAEDSISGSTGQDGGTPSSQKPSPIGDGCSPGIGPESGSTRTFEKSHRPVDTEDPEKWTETDVAPTLNGFDTGDTRTTLLISSQPDPLVKTSPSPDAGQASTAPEDTSSGSSSESQMPLFETEDGFSSRTCRVCSHRMGDGTFLPSSGRWPTSGFGIWPTEFWTAGSSEFPSGGGVCSSLPDVLQDEPPARFCLSPRAARGILRRAEKRGRELPQHLAAALTVLASTPPDGAKRTT